jgi:hypothetical protein
MMTTTITSPPYWSIGTKRINRWWLQRLGEEVSGKAARVAGVAPLWKRWSGGQRSTPRREEAVLEPPRNAHFTSSLVEPLAETLTLVGRPRLKMLNNIFDDEHRGPVS